MNDKIRNWKDTTWQIHPALNMPELEPEAVQFAVLDSDPIEAFRNFLVKNADKLQKELGDEGDLVQRELLKRVQITRNWDQNFRVVTGDQLHLLVPSRSKRNETLTRMTAISFNDPGGKKWFATKIVYRDDVPTCWCIPVETAIGKSVQVEFRKENALDLPKLYNEIIKAE